MKNPEDYPRVLILGHGFNSTSGGGITLTNLFKGWDKDKIAVATGQTDFIDATICERYYHFGSLEDYWVFPFSLIPRHGKVSQPITVRGNSFSATVTSIASTDPPETPARKNFYRAVKFFGAEDILRRLCLSPQFLQWVADFKPEVIYTQLASLNLIRLVTQLTPVTNAAIAIHMMDDWHSTLYRRGILSPYLRWRMNVEFRQLLKRAGALMGISQKMCDAFQSRYARNFLPFHNSLDLSAWMPAQKNAWKASTPFRFVYTGRIGKANAASLRDLGDTIAELNATGHSCRLDIFTPDHHTAFSQTFHRPGMVTLCPPIPYPNVPALLANADTLILPLDFDAESIEFARYSMPTKTAEYMISGTPTLVYAPAEMAVAEYARTGQWGYVVSERNKDALKRAMVELMENQSLRERLGRRAQTLAIQNHDARNVREAFRQALADAANRRSSKTSLAS
ncbi:MAG: glycosyltransferase [Chloroflexi bacterium]|nr:glycosyltransferase [Chloroflexota bacterium]